ncbi:SpaA isopeptide-forming pilin-related protein [Weissella confusa]|uniref:SpaA isopeptide-forming pilin-related protein n=1 Tax=Weissella confusa TaxID=1583 RepID=UPI0035A2AFA4
MAKWKNIALISTIVAPIAFGVGDAFAQADRPGTEGTTVVLHKKMQQGNGTTNGDSEAVYWGNGKATNWFDENKWVGEADVKFTAFSIPKSVISLKDGEPVITGDKIPGTEVAWNSVLKVTPGADITAYKEGSSNKLDYAIEFTATANMNEDQLRAAMEDAKYATVPFGKTNADGETTNDLTNGNWIILEDTKKPDVETRAAPMVLSLPMLDEEGWFGTSTPLNLYPKNYTDTADLTVVKEDGDTKKAGVAGALIGLFDLTDQGKTDLEAAIKAGLLSKSSDDILAWIKAHEATGVDLLYSGVTTDKGYKFTNLKPGAQYFVLELQAPKGYLVNGKLQEVNIDPASDGYDKDDLTVGTDANDTSVYRHGGVYKFANYDEPDLDKDINVLKPAAVTDLIVNGYDKEGNPIYDNKNADYSQTFVDNDTDFGVSRGKAYNYTVDLETNADLGTYTKFGITDNIPYQVNINSWTMYGRFGEGGVVDLGSEEEGLVPLIQAVDPDGDTPDHSTTDGLHQPSTPYDTDKGTGVSFKFYNQDAADAFNYPGTVYAEGDPEYKQSLKDQTAWISANLIHMYGFNGQYSFDAKNQAVQFDAKGDTTKLKNGEMNIDFSEKFLQDYSHLTKFGALTEQGVSSSIVFKMNAQTNSAAQANVGGTNKNVTEGVTPQTNMINNFVTFKYDNGFVSGSMYDQSQTNAVGWEFQKTDSKGNPVSGAGFDLGRLVTKENVENVISQLIGNKNNGNVVSDETKIHMADKMGFTGNNAAKITQVTNYLDGQADVLRKAVADGSETFVWFIHLTAAADASGNKQPIVDAMDSHMEMGDIYWVTDKRWATTHLSGVDRGYFQYCGVADGNYVLHEEITPKGYKQMDDLKFTIGANDSFYVNADGTAKNKEYPTVTSAGDNQQMPFDNQITGRVGEDATAEDNWASIKNYKKSVLPVVGGVGALSLFFIGAIAMIASYIKRKTDMREN